LVRRELQIIGAYDAKPDNFTESINLIAKGQVDVDSVLTHKFCIDEAEEAFKLAINRAGGKIVFNPN
jgi:L-iditol 2-dehydrogenase